METKQLLTIDEARQILKVGRNVMYGLIKTGVPYIKIGKQIRIPHDDFISWIKHETVS